MSEEIGFIETGGGAEGGSEVSEAELSRVREDSKAAAGMRAQIIKSGKRNKQYAKLLSLLLMYVDDEKLLQIIFKQLVDEKVPVEVIVGEFLPYLHQRVDVSPLKPLYVKVWDSIMNGITTREQLAKYFEVLLSSFAQQETETVQELEMILALTMQLPFEEKKEE